MAKVCKIIAILLDDAGPLKEENKVLNIIFDQFWLSARKKFKGAIDHCF